jgi:hypothetical protein
MKIKKVVSLFLGLVGTVMVGFSLIQGAISGAVIGVNSTSKFLGIFGIILMVLAIIIERRDSEKKK